MQTHSVIAHESDDSSAAAELRVYTSTKVLLQQYK